MTGLYLRGAETGVCVFPKYFDSEAVKRPLPGQVLQARGGGGSLRSQLFKRTLPGSFPHSNKELKEVSRSPFCRWKQHKTQERVKFEAGVHLHIL